MAEKQAENALKYESVIKYQTSSILNKQILCGSEVWIAGCHSGGLGSILTDNFFLFFHVKMAKNGRKSLEIT